MTTVTILGEGLYGTALGGVLAEGGARVQYYDPYTKHNDLAAALDGAGMVLMCAPSAVAPELLPFS